MKKYNIIYANPPWDYTDPKVGEFNLMGAQSNYKGIPLDELKSLPIPQITESNCCCFLWVPVPLTVCGLDVLRAWGFKYTSLVVWKKEGRLGLGNFFRLQTENILVGIKGNVPQFKEQRKNVIEHKTGEHSKKPHLFREIISSIADRIFHEPEKLELFAKSGDGMFADLEHEGWDVYGNEATNSIKLPTD